MSAPARLPLLTPDVLGGDSAGQRALFAQLDAEARLQYGPAHAAGVGMSVPSQRATLEAALRVGDLARRSLLDVGSGYGHLIDLMAEQHILPHEYTGLEISHPQLMTARLKYPHADFRDTDLLSTRSESPITTRAGEPPLSING